MTVSRYRSLDEPKAVYLRTNDMGNANSTKVDTHNALLAANAVMTNGVHDNSGYHWRGITVVTDADGYTVTLKDESVELQLLFHNKFRLKSRNRFSHIAFVEKIDTIVKATRR